MKKLNELLCEILECNEMQLSNNKLFKDLDNWDSMRYMMLVMRIESDFGVALSPEEIQRLTSESEVLNVLQEKGINE